MEKHFPLGVLGLKGMTENTGKAWTYDIGTVNKLLMLSKL